MSLPFLSFDRVSIRMFNKIIFENLSFTIRKGQHWAIVGNSGSGKSVLLDAIAGRASFPAGQVRYPALEEYLHQHHANDPLKTKFSLISYVSSRHNFKNLSNTTDLYYQQRFNSTDSDDAQTVISYLETIAGNHPGGYWTVNKVVSDFSLIALQDKQLFKLSNGETKRLMIAAALLRQPLLLLLDNPLTGLDVESRSRSEKLFEMIAASGMSIVMATSPREIPSIISHVCVLDKVSGPQQMEVRDFSANMVHGESQDLPDRDKLRDIIGHDNSEQFDLIARLENINIRYGDKPILRNVNWEIRQGERWMLLGSNGAGKSTLLSLINGDNPQAFANNIVLFDRPKGQGESIWDIKKRIGFVSPELFQYFPQDISCIQVVESGFYDTMGLFRRPSPEKTAKCRQWMALLAIEEYGDVLFRNVPVSVQRLCLFARAMVKTPSLLILDEPCQGLDKSQQERFRSLVDEVCRQSTVSLIYVSHYQEDRPSAVTRTIRLDNGVATIES